MTNESLALEDLESALAEALIARDAARERVPDPDAWERMPDPTRAQIARWSEVDVAAHSTRLLELLGRPEVAWARAAALALRSSTEAALEGLRAWAPEHPEDLGNAHGELWLELAPLEAVEAVFAALGDVGTLEALWRWVPGGMITNDPMLASLIDEGEDVGELIADAYMASRSHEPGATIAAAAARAIARTRHGRALEILRDVWGRFVNEDAAHFVRLEVLWGLFHLGDDAGLDLAVEAMSMSGLSNAASRAISRMGDAGEEAAEGMVREWAADPDMRYPRHDAARTLARSASERTDAALAELVEDRDHAVRQIARHALSARGIQEMLVRLVSELEGDEPERDDALELLALHPNPAARVALEGARDDAREAGDDFLAEDIVALIQRWDVAFS